MQRHGLGLEGQAGIIGEACQAVQEIRGDLTGNRGAALGARLLGGENREEAVRETFLREHGLDRVLRQIRPPVHEEDGCDALGQAAGSVGGGQGVRRGDQTDRFRSRRLSRSDRPPQMPNRSSLPSAYSRHSLRTVQEAQTFLASRVEPPFSGKKASGSV